MKREDLKIMKNTVTALIQATTNSLKPTEKEIDDFDDLYHRMKNSKEKSFIDGVMVSAQFLAFDCNGETLAEHLLIFSGISMNDLLASQESSDFENERMKNVIKEAFRRKKY